ncbi:hypothetical protein TNCV_432211 [Trichonephila clavipes]|nr:hypothetical protein TNCV_432211 [Trichonephila clavipes]
MPDLFDVKRGRIIGVSFAGVPCPEQSNLRVLHGPLYEVLYQACTNLETQDYTAENNIRDEYHLQDSVSKKTIEQELQIFMAPSSYSKTVSFGVGYYKETTVVMRPPKLDINIMGTSHPLSDESSFTLFHTTENVFVCRTPAEAFHVDCLVPNEKSLVVSVMV